MFTDNDELSGMVAAMMDAEALIILSNIDGIYNGNPSESGTEVIRDFTASCRVIQTGNPSSAAADADRARCRCRCDESGEMKEIEKGDRGQQERGYNIL